MENSQWQFVTNTSVTQNKWNGKSRTWFIKEKSRHVARKLGHHVSELGFMSTQGEEISLQLLLHSHDHEFPHFTRSPNCSIHKIIKLPFSQDHQIARFTRWPNCPIHKITKFLHSQDHQIAPFTRTPNSPNHKITKLPHSQNHQIAPFTRSPNWPKHTKSEVTFCQRTLPRTDGRKDEQGNV